MEDLVQCPWVIHSFDGVGSNIIFPVKACCRHKCRRAITHGKEKETVNISCHWGNRKAGLSQISFSMLGIHKIHHCKKVLFGSTMIRLY